MQTDYLILSNGLARQKVLDPPLRPYWQFCGEITMGDGLLLCGQRCQYGG